jgi:PilZ domain-containing protein
MNGPARPESDSNVRNFTELISAAFENLFCGFATMIEKRAAPRFKVLKGGMAAVDGGNIPCTVRNMSSTGAAVEFAQRVDLPSTFTLVIERDRFSRRCRPVWNNKRRVGLAFC